MKFSGKNVLITGGSRGIGAEIARVLANFGLKVWINYRGNEEVAQNLKAEIARESEIIKFDVSNEKEFSEAIKHIVKVDGTLSYLVNNAGITNDKLAIRMKLEDFNSVIDANLNGTFIGCREALKVMSKKRFGAIVNVSSIVSEMGNAGQTNYSASKGAVNSMTKSFALEGAVRGIRFNAVTPGFIITDMTNELTDEVKANYANAIPLKRFGEAKEVAEAIAFLLSDYSSYITGEILKINGGLYR